MSPGCKIIIVCVHNKLESARENVQAIAFLGTRNRDEAAWRATNPEGTARHGGGSRSGEVH